MDPYGIIIPTLQKIFSRKDPITNLTIRERIEDNKNRGFLGFFLAGWKGMATVSNTQNNLGLFLVILYL